MDEQIPVISEQPPVIPGQENKKVSWGAKRRLLYILGFALVVIILLGIPLFFILNRPGNCFDSVQNGDEVGIDCGGSCTKVCSADVVDPIVRWHRPFIIDENQYNLLAYGENPNSGAVVPEAEYVFTVFDRRNKILKKIEGKTNIPEKRIFGVFDGPVNFENGVPKRVSFEFIKPLNWQKVTPTEFPIRVIDKKFSEQDTIPRIDARIENTSLIDVKNVEVVGIVYDNIDNAIGVSKTEVDYLEKGTSQNIVFTWPKPLALAQDKCEANVDVVLALDRSGSMDDEGDNPPQPLTDSKDAAKAFISELRAGDQVGIVSFATNGSVDQELSGSLTEASRVVDDLKILTNGVQHTNISDAIKFSFAEFDEKGKPESKDVIIMLTDGIASRPLRSGNSDYPMQAALLEAEVAKNAGVVIYAIGLGNKVEDEFMIELATSPAHYFEALDSTELQGIYQDIAVSFCDRRPGVIEVIPKLTE